VCGWKNQKKKIFLVHLLFCFTDAQTDELIGLCVDNFVLKKQPKTSDPDCQKFSFGPVRKQHSLVNLDSKVILDERESR